MHRRTSLSWHFLAGGIALNQARANSTELGNGVTATIKLEKPLIPGSPDIFIPNLWVGYNSDDKSQEPCIGNLDALAFNALGRLRNFRSVDIREILNRGSGRVAQEIAHRLAPTEYGWCFNDQPSRAQIVKPFFSLLRTAFGVETQDLDQ